MLFGPRMLGVLMMELRKIGVVLAGLIMSMGIVSANPMNSQQQIDILAETGTGNDGWFVEPARDEKWGKWYYAVTDLNHDGNLEILKAKSGFYDDRPCLECEELTGQKGQRRKAVINPAGSAHVPDVLSSESSGKPIVIKEKGSKRYYYIFEEIVMHGEFESDTSKYAVCLDGDLFIAELATKNWRLSGKDGSVRNRYYISDPLKEKVSEKRYNNIVRERFPGAVEKAGKIQWLSAGDVWVSIGKGNIGELLKKSYCNFQ
ncbi:hypothetical protein SELR_pSRC101470 (plasmid) [Selenomonas ruminantium subsp. lactilytica TAM6421]|uniref:Uncharacterized protein n=2 Tax=Selenomonas ruminantium TaxID=971 RepID=I0GW17_SELRL|nr:hypothetical protein SELR_pSRC101470 [Selenomonas ruminantium subsp. lactilytica TAM6421]